MLPNGFFSLSCITGALRALPAIQAPTHLRAFFGFWYALPG
tara:strand:- start:1100 stop:1222 length:123 start_codon:yes stop_codon:yes gene_type:complete